MGLKRVLYIPKSGVSGCSQGGVLSQISSLPLYSFSPIPFQGLSMYTHLFCVSFPGSFVKTRPSGHW